MTDDPWLFALALAPGVLVAAWITGLAAAALARRRRTWAAVAVASSILVIPANGLGGSLALARAFEATAHANPSQKAVLLAEGIGEVLRATAASMAVVLLATVFALGAVLWTPRVISEQEGA